MGYHGSDETRKLINKMKLETDPQFIFERLVDSEGNINNVMDHRGEYYLT
jgi:hypothetical protein